MFERAANPSVVTQSATVTLAAMARSRCRDPPPARRALARAALLAALACAAFPPAFASEDAETRRARKEAFHSGNAGTTFLEVSAVVAAAPLGVFIRRALDVMKGVRVTFGGIVADTRGRPLDPVHVVLKDAMCCVFPIAWAMFAPLAALPSLAALALLAYFLAGHFVARRALKAAPSTPNVVDAVPSPLGNVTRFGASRPYLTCYRASMTLATAVAILAVDFPAFPRRFGKTETFGVGLMDVGAGSFMFANALVSRRRGGRAAKDFFADIGPVRAAQRLAHRIGPLVALAAFRAWSTGAAGTHVPINEYGKHWNFFATLAAVMIFVDMAPVPPGTSTVFGGALLVAHQWCLSSRRMWSVLAGAKYLVEFRKAIGAAGNDNQNASPFAHETLGEWLLADARSETFVSQNKEGLFSVPGYVALYFLGVGIGVWMEKWLALDASRARKKVEGLVAELETRARRARESALEAAKTARDPEARARAAKKSREADALDAEAESAQKRQRHRHAKETYERDTLISRVTMAPGGRADPHDTQEGGWGWAWRWCAKLSCVSCAFWIAALVAHHRVQPASRRIANAAYGLWMVAFNIQIIAAYVAGALVFPGSLPAPKLFQGANRNLLGTFLFANVATGAVNFFWDGAMDAADATAYVVVAAYTALVCVFAIASGADEVAMDNRRIGRKAD